MAYPTGDDLQAFLVTAGIVEANTNEALDYQGYVDAAIAQWEADTGYKPFLAAEEATTRTYDTPDGFTLDMRGGLLSIEVDGFTMDGRALVAGVDYDLFPYNAAAEGKPYLAVQFRYRLDSRYANPRNISLEGTFGYATSLPADVLRAILSIAAFSIATTVSGASGTITQIRQDDVTISYGSNSASNQYTASQLQLKAFYDSTLARYRRVRLT